MSGNCDFFLLFSHVKRFSWNFFAFVSLFSGEIKNKSSSIFQIYCNLRAEKKTYNTVRPQYF